MLQKGVMLVVGLFNLRTESCSQLALLLNSCFAQLSWLLFCCFRLRTFFVHQYAENNCCCYRLLSSAAAAAAAAAALFAAGGGHKASAEALKQAFQEKYGNKYKVSQS
jgi:hypothetical protein